MSLDLPAEIWAHVLRFLPQEDRAKLYSVNRHLFHLVLSERYQTVGIQSSKGPREFKRLKQVLSYGTYGHVG